MGGRAVGQAQFGQAFHGPAALVGGVADDGSLTRPCRLHVALVQGDDERLETIDDSGI